MATYQGCHFSNYLPSRIARKLTVDDLGCWIWTGQQSSNGYGRVWWAGKNRVAHRVIWKILIGHIPKDYVLDHVAELCSNRLCCSPLHLEPVTSQENTRRGKAVLIMNREHYEVLPESLDWSSVFD